MANEIGSWITRINTEARIVEIPRKGRQNMNGDYFDYKQTQT